MPTLVLNIGTASAQQSRRGFLPNIFFGIFGKDKGVAVPTSLTSEARALLWPYRDIQNTPATRVLSRAHQRHRFFCFLEHLLRRQ
jgi:hypothetical protein